MPPQDRTLLTDEALDQFARRWFADVRAEHPEPRLSSQQRDAAGEVGAGALDWLFSDDDGAVAGADGGD
ncbi:hypothetical protein MKK70_00980 [Methylobacterium sp. E-041]|uniref:hypothetical protein n=1 Tax=unclassified Methylobacterium TaxID=2615210 RepID=UPI001FB95ACF|nr:MULTISPECIES: hypothetical protein [unclassified Methylobacterium]MCJ2009083.1 hypothetical protein [Methylobacterium sp. J-092]MCJ2103979.1 hypothetical protein [Methylobacterium sp. E-041]